MTMEIVNGVPCFNCTDVEKAKKVGLNAPDTQDPLHPSTQIANPQTTSSNAAGNASGYANAEPLGVNQPLTSGDRGTKINIAT